MEGVIFVLFSLCVILFLGMAHFLLASKRYGAYPPKYILRQRAGVLGAGGVLFFLIGLLLYMFQ
jgi:hypothetical protein